MIYLDNSSTTFPKPLTVINAVTKYLEEGVGNPGRSAGASTNILLETRQLITKFINAPDDPSRIIFTASSTDSLNTAIKGFLKNGDHVITTSMEHNSVARPLKFLETKGIIELTIVKGSTDGCIDPEDIRKAIRRNTSLIVSTHASNVTGTIIPIKEIGQIAWENGIKFLVDASQSIGVLPVDVQSMNIDLLAFPGHKNLFAPAGTGALYIKEGVELKPFRHGGTGVLSDTLLQPEKLPFKFESGTCNLIGIAGLNAGIKYIMEVGSETIRKHEINLMKYLTDYLSEMNNVILYGPKDINKKVSALSINIDGKSAEEVGSILASKYDIITRPGIQCAPLAHNTIGTLAKGGTLRISPGYFNTLSDIEQIVKALKEIQ